LYSYKADFLSTPDLNPGPDGSSTKLLLLVPDNYDLFSLDI
jgi:hypothetical protein